MLVRANRISDKKVTGMGLKYHYPPVTVLFRCYLEAGEIVDLIRLTDTRKTTRLNVGTGALPASGGDIMSEDTPILGKQPYAIARP